jgi:predicted transcriptional regulator
MKKYTIQLSNTFDEILDQEAEAKGISKSEVIRRAVASYAYLSEEMKEGRRVSITDKSGEVLKDVVLP